MKKYIKTVFLGAAFLLAALLSGCSTEESHAGETAPFVVEAGTEETPASGVKDKSGTAAESTDSGNAPAPTAGKAEGEETTARTAGMEDGAGVAAAMEDTEAGAAEPDASGSFEVHFIDVGQADAALVFCDGHAMLIDGGNAADSSLIYTYLKDRSVDYLDCIVCTHAHEDHVGGLAGALNYATAGCALCPVTSYDSRAFNSFVTYLGKQGVEITVPAAGGSFSLGSASVQILGPIRLDAPDPNNTSIVLRVVYGNTSFLFTGDAEREEEQDILAAGYELESTVLKVGHHGSETSTTYPFLREIMPQYAVISVGADNSYGHPTEETLSRLRDAGAQVYRTDLQGDIVCTSDGETVSFAVERNADADTLGSAGRAPAEAEPGTESGEDPAGGESGAGQQDDSAQAGSGTDYVLNTNTHKFHIPSCSSVKQMKESNKLFYNGTREEVIGMGYDPCKRCNP